MAEKRRTEFSLPYVGIDDKSGKYPLLLNLKGDYAVIIKLNNPVLQYSADPAAYDNSHQLYINMIKILGEGYVIQKQDILCKRIYNKKDSTEYLQQKYDEHFSGREYTDHNTYLVVTRKAKRSSFFTYNKKQYLEFERNIGKLEDLFKRNSLFPSVLNKNEIDVYVKRILSMNFSTESVSLNNMLSTDEEIKMGSNSVRNISLVNVDVIDLPEKVSTHLERNDKPTLIGFPVDTMGFLYNVPSYKTIIYNQIIDIPPQNITQRKLELKRKRHSGIPDPANLMCVEDIDSLLVDVARENQMLVNSHFNIIVCATAENIQQTCNYIETSLSLQGITPNKNAYNQMELFRTALPCNTVELKDYDLFLTTSDAALCFFFKEALSKDEESSFQIRFTDRQGIPVAIDPADLPMNTNRINNRNKFVLGPSGSGKSFFMNVLIEQYSMYNKSSAPRWLMDVVIVDTGHSYSGLCSYYGGKYITYTDEKPITMNPFAIKEEEYNIEKKDFLKTLISLLWKGADGTINQVEGDVIAQVISSFYSCYFSNDSTNELYPEITDNAETEDIVLRVQTYNTLELNFNSFYEFALSKIPEIKDQEKIPFDIDEFRYVLKKFYKGGEFDAILNEKVDTSLFIEPFVVFEIDSIKEHKVLFPIVTLIIMDVFIQKMRFRTTQRKALIIEEAWKAIASPLMASYILYLYKTVRKFWGEAIVVTQELGDIIGNAVVKDSIINNSDTVILLDQTKFKDNFDEIAKLLSITEHERKKIFTINQLDNTENRDRFKEVYIRRGAIGEVYGVEVSLHQYLAFTTEKPEKTTVDIYSKYYGSYQIGLENFVNDLKLSKLKLDKFFKQINQKGTPFFAEAKSTPKHLQLAG